jgi:proliferating cell nuclear antigen
MFEARLAQGQLIKKVVEAIKDLVTDANLECSPEALTLQASC